MQNKKLKERLINGETVLGSWNTIASPALIEIIGYCKWDFIVIDSEHGPIEIERAENLIRAAEITNMAPVFRVPSNENNFILKALDLGVQGIQIPHISTEKEAQRAVERAKYYPKGKRGFSPFTRAARYGLDAQGYTDKANNQTALILNIEGREGIKNLKKIVKVPDIDVIFLGPYDLSQSIGKPGQVEDPEVINCIKQSVKIIKAQGLTCGSFARDMKYLDILINCGIRYLTYMVDSTIILNTYREHRESSLKKINRIKQDK